MEVFIIINSLLFILILIFHFRIYKDGRARHKSPKDVLKERYARGKMSKYEYDVKIRDIE